MKVSWKKTLPVFWSLLWRGILYGSLGGGILGVIGGVIAVVMHTPEKAYFYGTVGGYIAAIPAYILALKQALSKHLSSLAAIANATEK